MMRRAVALALLFLPATLTAQMTVDGRVTDQGGGPVAGASVSIAALGISVRTSAEGRYNFIIRQAQVRGQTVEMVARHSRYGSQSAMLAVTGGSATRDFVLAGTTRVPARPPRDSARPDAGGDIPDTSTTVPGGRLLSFDSTQAADIPSALAGQFAPMSVGESSAEGGSDLITYRGLRSLFGNVQPLVVVDGVPVDNQGFTTTAQRFGFGGFDYGSALQDLAVADVASIELVDPATAALEFGARAANGVLRITTRDGRGISGTQFTVTPRIAVLRPSRLPAYQSQYGQGLAGDFEFFDGRGGGINDAIAQSWGPRLDGRPLAQHSLTEAGRPDVRFWLPRPDGVRDYFAGATDVDVSVALLGSRGPAHFRAALNAGDAGGLTPRASRRRLGATLNGGTAFSARMRATVSLQVINSSARHRPGTGFDEANPVAGFTRFGRQVDIDALRDNVVDADGNQINWIYTARNNPFFATTMNANDDDRTQVIAAGGLQYRLARWLTSRVLLGGTDYSEMRTVTVSSGWRGGFATTLGRGDFGGGGRDQSSLSAGERVIGLDLDGQHGSWRGTRFTSSAGVALRTNDFETRASVTDQPLVGAATVTTSTLSGRDDHRAVHARLSAVRHAFVLAAGARLEQSEVAERRFTTIFPSVSASYDLLGSGSAREWAGLGRARVHGSAWSAGNEVGSRTLTQLYYGGVPIAPTIDIVGPERTTGVQLGTVLGSAGGRVTVEVTGYRERSTDLLVATAPGDGSAVLSQSGQVFNGGLEGTARVSVARGQSVSWDIDGSFSRNVNTVDALQPGVARAPLAPAVFGATSSASIGSSTGVIVGSRYLRDASGSLILRGGLPLPDNGGLAILGSAQPDWTATLRSRIGYRGIELVAMFDARVGGEVFSATNLWGSYAGTLSSTLVGDRDASENPVTLADSLVIAGVDSASGLANATRVSAEQYFHALGEITEPWVYDASVARLRLVQLSYSLPMRMVPGLREHVLRFTLVGRNLALWSRAPNIEPGLTFSSQPFQGFEMGQLPGVRSLGLHFSLAP